MCAVPFLLGFRMGKLPGAASSVESRLGAEVNTDITMQAGVGIEKNLSFGEVTLITYELITKEELVLECLI